MSQHNIIIGADLKGIRKEVGTIGALFKTQFAMEAGKYVAQFVQELAALAQEVDKVNRALNAVGGNSQTVKKMADAAGGLVTNLELATNAAEALAKGMNEDLIDEATAFSTTFSQLTGRTFSQAFQMVETAFIKPTREAFTNLGLDWEAYTELVKQGFTQQEAAAKVMQDRMEELGPITLGVASQIDQQRVAWENLKEELSQELLPVMSAVLAYFRVFKNVATDWGQFGRAMIPGNIIFMVREEMQAMQKLRLKTTGSGMGPSNGGPFRFTDFPGVPAAGGTAPAAATGPGRRAQQSPVALATAEMAAFTVELGQNTEALKSNIFEGQVLLDNFEAMQRDLEVTGAWVDYFGNSLSQAFEAALFSGEDFFKVMGDYLKNFLQQMVAALATAIALKGVLSLFGFGTASTVGSIFSQLMGFPKLAEGGLVTKPTLALIGEKGPEAVVPLGRMGGMGGMGVTTVRVAGNDLLLAIQRTNYNQGRAGSLGGYK